MILAQVSRSPNSNTVPYIGFAIERKEVWGTIFQDVMQTSYEGWLKKEDCKLSSRFQGWRPEYSCCSRSYEQRSRYTYELKKKKRSFDLRIFASTLPLCLPNENTLLTQWNDWCFHLIIFLYDFAYKLFVISKKHLKIYFAHSR